MWRPRGSTGFNSIFISSTIRMNKWKLQRRTLVPLPVLTDRFNGDDVTIWVVLMVIGGRRGIATIAFLIKCQVCLQVWRVHFFLGYFTVITDDMIHIFYKWPWNCVNAIRTLRKVSTFAILKHKILHQNRFTNIICNDCPTLVVLMFVSRSIDLDIGRYLREHLVSDWRNCLDLGRYIWVKVEGTINVFDLNGQSCL